MKNSILLVFSLVYSFVFSQDLTVERIWKNYEFSPKRIGGFKSMNDGEHYTNMKEELLFLMDRNFWLMEKNCRSMIMSLIRMRRKFFF
jgi:hypothetical protein